MSPEYTATSRLNEIHAILAKYVPRQESTACEQSTHQAEPKYRLAKIVRDGEVVDSQLISSDNFFFTPLPVPDARAGDDVFPRSGIIQLKSDYSNSDELVGRRKDISVFTPDGMKVFWGDLLFADIKNLTDTYYLLGQGESYHSVPSWAKVLETGQDSVDHFRPGGSIVASLQDPDPPFVRLKPSC